MMKQKVSALLLLTAILSIVMVSAALDFTVTTPNPLTTSDSDNTFIITNNDLNNLTITYSSPITIANGASTITLTLDKASEFVVSNVTDTETVKVTRGTIPEGWPTGVYSASLVLTADNGTSTDTRTVTIPFVKDTCTAGSQNASGLSYTVDVTNNGEGDDLKWLPLDDIEIKVDFTNDKSEIDENNLDSAIVKLAIIDKDTGTDIASKMDWISTGDEEGKLKDVDAGEDVSHTFEFKVPADEKYSKDNKDYWIMVKVYPKDTEESTCIDYDDSGAYYQDLEINRETEEERAMIFDNIASQTVECDKDIEVTAKVYNIGSDDQDAIKVFLYNKELGINSKQVIENFDAGDSQTIIFDKFRIPKGMAEKTYTLSLYTKYDYDEDDDEDSSGEVDFDDASFDTTTDSQKVYLTVSGNCKIQVASSKITAELDAETPEPTAGKQVVVKTTITNDGDKETTYVVSAEGYKDWATLASISSQSFTLAPGESKNIDVSLNVNANAEGEKDFTIKTSYENGGQTTSQKVALTVAKPAAQTGIISSVKEHVKSNSFLYMIAAINLILIIAIVSIVKKSLAGAAASRASDDF